MTAYRQLQSFKYNTPPWGKVFFHKNLNNTHYLVKIEGVHLRNPTLVLTLVLVIAFGLITINPTHADTADYWISKASMQVARADLGVAEVDGKIYAIGGTTQTLQQMSVPNGYPADEGETAVGTNEQYDPATNTWTFKAPMPDPLVSFAIAAYSGNIYCIGGESNNTITEVYNPATDTWENKAPMPISFWPLQASIVNNKIYVVGGSAFGSFYNEVYDPATDTWTAKTPIPREGAYIGYESTGAGNKIFVLGGFNLLSGGEPYEIYDSQTDNWTRGTTCPLSVASGAAVATTGVFAPERIYLIGAQYPEQTDTFPFPTQIYDPSTDSWRSGAAMPTGRTDFGMVNLNDTLYAIGGYTFDWSTNANVPMTPTPVCEQYIPVGYSAANPPPSTPTSSPTATQQSTPFNNTALTTDHNSVPQAVWIIAAAAVVIVGWVAIFLFRKKLTRKD